MMLRVPKKYSIRITADSVDAEWDDINRPIRIRVLGIAAVTCAELVIVYFTFLRPDRNGYSTWFRLMHEHWASGYHRDAGIPIGYAFLLSLIFALLVTRAFFPTGERLRCDRTQLTVEEIPWFNLVGKWSAKSFPIEAISDVTLGIWPTKGRETLYLVSFQAYGKTRKILRGISAPAGYRVLKGLKALGVDALEISDARYFAKEAIRDQRAEL